MKNRLKSLFKRENGITLVEAIVSIALIAIISAGVTTLLFFNVRTTKLSEKQSHDKDIARIVKENVVYSARTGDPILNNEPTDIVAKNYTGTDLNIQDMQLNKYDDYKFDVKYMREINYTSPSKRVQQYNIKIYDSEGIIMDFNIEVYKN